MLIFFWEGIAMKRENSRNGGGGSKGHTFEILTQRYTSNCYRQPNAGKNHSDQNI